MCSGCLEEEITEAAGQLPQWQPWNPWRKWTEGRPGALRGLQKKRKDETIAEVAQCHRKARSALLEHQVPATQHCREKMQPWSKVNPQLCRAVPSTADFLPDPHWHCRTPPQPKFLLEHQASPQPAVLDHVKKAENTTEPSFSANHSLIFLFVQQSQPLTKC